MSSPPSAVRGRQAAPSGVTVLSELGRGAQTVVYRVRRGRRDFAMKVYVGALPPDGGALVAFRREAALIAWAHHPGLAAVHEVGEVDGRPYLIMDFIEGRELRDELAGAPLSPARTVDIGIQVAEALSAAHRVGLVHRDVKPQNILVQPDGSTRIIDFGLAVRAGRAMDDTVAGTLTYVAPEQTGILNRPVDARSDLYSLGVVLYECVTGVPPFVTDDPGELMHRHATLAAPDPRVHRPDLPAGFVAVISKLLAKDPDDRYQSCRGLIADLRALGPDASGDVDPGQHDDTGDDIQAPMIGRTQDTMALAAAWQRTRGGVGGSAVVRGASGIGKSTLVRAFAEEVRAAGHPVVLAQCADGAAPLSALTAAIRHELGAAPLGTPAETADLLVTRAGEAGGLVLILDDAQWLDSATRIVLDHMAPRLADTPLLLVAACDDDMVCDSGTTCDRPADACCATAVPDWLPGPVDPLVVLRPLDAVTTAELIRAAAGGMRLGADVTQRLSARCGGTPLAVLEYLAAVVDAGLLIPHQGSWGVDTDGLARMSLPADVLGLMLRRVDLLGADGRQLLTVAAAAGMAFEPDLVVRAADLPADEARETLELAIARGVLARAGNEFAFVHDRLRRALLDEADPDRLRDVNQRLADALAPGQPYAMARYLRRGHAEREPARVARACAVAGRQALHDHAAGEAADLLEQAIAFGERAGLTVDCGLLEALGTAYHRIGRLADAISVLERAIGVADDRLDRARVLGRLARVRQSEWELGAALRDVAKGLAALGGLPRNWVLSRMFTVVMYVLGFLIERTGIGFGTRDEHRAARYRLQSELYAIGANIAVRTPRLALTIAYKMRSRYASARLGLSQELVRNTADMAALHQFITNRPARRGFARAKRLAEQLGDPGATAYVGLMRRLAGIQTEQPDASAYLDWLDRHGRLLETSDTVDYVHSLCLRMLLKGYAAQAVDGFRRGRGMLSAADLARHMFGQLGAAAQGAVGEPVTAWRDLPLLDPDLAPYRNHGTRAALLVSYASLAVEQQEAGAVFDRIAGEFARLRINPRLLMQSLRPIYAFIAYGRLEQCRRATAEELPLRLAQARTAIAELRRAVLPAGPGPQLRAHHAVARAELTRLRGDHERALAQLHRAERVLRHADAPLARYEAARVQARALTSAGDTIGARAYAAVALSIADQIGWAHRAAWVRTEFGRVTTHVTATTPTGLAASATVDRRRLAALERLSVTASRVLDPNELIRVALAETVSLLGAERALLFLTGDGDRSLRAHLGLNAAGVELRGFTDYASTLVERVRLDRQPIIVTGTDEGAALGSQSVVAHGLRSIMAAPLQFEGRLLGVVYLDSRIAKGMFTADDIGSLSAITNHIAAALETARAAQLAVAVQSAQRQRDVSERLRDAMADLSATLDPDEVLRRLGLNMASLLPVDHTCLVVLDRDGPAIAWGPGLEVQAITDPALDRLVAAEAPVTGGTDLVPAGLLDTVAAEVRSWLAVPLASREGPVGLVVVASTEPGRYGDAEIHLAAAVASEGMVAYDKAHLFVKLERLATTDPLTGALNRRHFFDLAGRWIIDRRRAPDGHPQSGHAARSMATMMLDIDHFKAVNDNYGHQVGDQVIRAVALRLQDALRPGDLLGRYGGEEFAIVLARVGEEAEEVAERLRAVVADHPVETDSGPLAVTVSIGVAWVNPDSSELTEALGHADDALYRAKQAGRNRVAVYS